MRPATSVAVTGQAGGEAAQFGVAGAAGTVDPGVEVLAGALVADQRGGSLIMS
ncbi:hypothetical protein [Micromonospora sp. NPDC002575]|uniref:hypothetical protein n=1 Tax=Micromonospora sp. NPDC002575 TaxID=3364222 RepID=UPI00367E2733